MNRLKNILLAGTFVPALVLAPMANAQAPAPEEKKLPGAPPAPKAAPPAAPPHAAPPPAAPRAAPPAAPHAAPPVAPPPVPHAAPPAAPHAAPPAAPPPAAAPHAPPRAAAPEPAPHAAPTAPHAATPGAAVPNPAAPVERRAVPAPTPNAPAAPGHAAPNATAPHAPGPATAPGTAPNASEPHSGQPGTPHTGAPPAATPGAAGPPRNNSAAPATAAPPAAPNAERGPAGRPGAPGAAGAPGAPGAPGPNGNRQGGISPGGAAAIGAAAGFAGGFIAATAGAQHLDQIRGARQEVREDGRTFIREPGRTIVEDGDQAYVVHDENDRFRELGYDVRRERSGGNFVDVIDRPGGVQILTFTDPDGRMLRRVRRYPDGREIVLIDNGFDGRVRPPQDDVVVLAAPPIGIPQNRYVVDYADADEGLIYDTLSAPPLQPPPQRYTLDQIRYSPDIRRYVRAVDINTINFDSGSWIVPGASTGKLQALADAIKRSVERNANAVFLVEGFTDATGNPTDNLSLSDRRAQSVAAILSKDFGVPPENLTTQGYGQQFLKVNTSGPSAENRRVVVQNITPLLAAGGSAPR